MVGAALSLCTYALSPSCFLVTIDRRKIAYFVVVTDRSAMSESFKVLFYCVYYYFR